MTMMTYLHNEERSVHYLTLLMLELTFITFYLYYNDNNNDDLLA